MAVLAVGLAALAAVLSYRLLEGWGGGNWLPAGCRAEIDNHLILHIAEQFRGQSRCCVLIAERRQGQGSTRQRMYGLGTAIGIRFKIIGTAWRTPIPPLALPERVPLDATMARLRFRRSHDRRTEQLSFPVAEPAAFP